MIGAQRETLLQMRDEGRINDEVLRRVERDLDLEEARLEPRGAERAGGGEPLR